MDDDVPAVVVLGIPIARLTTQDALDRICAFQGSAGPATVAFANAHTLNLAVGDPEFHATLRGCDLLLNDGSGVQVAAWLQGRRFPENLNGTDLVPRLLDRASQRGWRIAFVGARPGIADQARDHLVERFADLHIVLTHDGYFTLDGRDSLVAEIRAADVDLLLVAMGNPLQEQWLADHLEATGAKVGIAVGAFLDFASHHVPRSPDLLRRLGIEWIYRLYTEPRRLWPRYVLGNPLFVWRIITEQFNARRTRLARSTQ